jgi:hypothetical protein
MIEGETLERPTGSSHLAFGMAALVAAGGATGYAKTGSVPSLVAGLGIAALFGAGGQQINVSCVCTQACERKRELPLSPAQPSMLPCPWRPVCAERAARHRAPCEPCSISGACRRHGPSIHQNPQGLLLNGCCSCCCMAAAHSPADPFCCASNAHCPAAPGCRCGRQASWR